LSAERLQKVLASAGIASRRDCEELISAGRVSVNGRVVRVLGARVDPEHDEIAVDGRPIGRLGPRTYVLLHKPPGVVSTVDDPQGRPTVIDLVDLPVRLFPVGRLDYESEGLLLLTDDGELTQRLTHPSYEVEKEYRALLDRMPTPDALREWRAGVMLDGVRTAPAWVEVLEHDDSGAWVRVVLHEGRKRQIREVARLLGYNVLRLIRVREGPLSLGDLPVGAWRRLSAEEVEALWEHLGNRDGEHRHREPGEAVDTRERSVGGAEVLRRRPRQDRPAEPRGASRARSTQRAERGERDAPAAAGRPPRAAGDRPPARRAGQPARPWREDRPAAPRGARRTDARERGDRSGGARRAGAPNPTRSERPRAQRRDERWAEDSSDRRGDRPERGNERLPARDRRAPKPGPGRAWRAQQAQEQRERKQRQTQGWRRSTKSGAPRPPKRTGFPFRSPPPRDDDDES
jgi:23S rRNA pseudouridine2605 synthase